MQNILKDYVLSFTQWKILTRHPSVILIKIFYSRSTISENVRAEKVSLFEFGERLVLASLKI